MIDVTEIYEHWDAGRSKLAMSESLGIDRKTISKYLEPAEKAGMTPGSGRAAAGRRNSGRTWSRSGSRSCRTCGCGRSRGRRSRCTGTTSWRS